MALATKRRIITHALFAGWGPDVNQSDWFRKILVLKKGGYFIKFTLNGMEIGRIKQKKRDILLERSYKRVNFSPANEFELVFICAKRGSHFTFNLKSPAGVVRLEYDHELDPLMVNAKIILEELTVKFGRAPYFAEFSGQLQHVLRLSERKIADLIRRGAGKYWRVEKMHEVPPRHYYYPIEK